MVRSKLVRDGIPELARARGQTVVVSRLDDAAYLSALKAKLLEEAEEFAKHPSLEELADVLEVVQTLAGILGTGKHLEEVRRAKAESRGGFDGRVFMSWED